MIKNGQNLFQFVVQRPETLLKRYFYHNFLSKTKVVFFSEIGEIYLNEIFNIKNDRRLPVWNARCV